MPILRPWKLQTSHCNKQTVNIVYHPLLQVEQRLFVHPWDQDTESRLRDNENLQREISALQTEIGMMNKASQQLMAEAGAENRNLIRLAVEELNERWITLITKCLKEFLRRLISE